MPPARKSFFVRLLWLFWFKGLSRARAKILDPPVDERSRAGMFDAVKHLIKEEGGNLGLVHAPISALRVSLLEEAPCARRFLEASRALDTEVDCRVDDAAEPVEGRYCLAGLGVVVLDED